MCKQPFDQSIRTLKRMRDTYHSQLDIRVVEELNQVITNLEEEGDKERKRNASLRALEVMAVIIKIVSNLTDLM